MAVGRFRSVVIVGALLPVVVLATATKTHAAPGKCEVVAIFDPICEAGKTIAGKTKDLATAPFRYVAGGAVDMMTSWVSDTAQWILNRVVSFIDRTTTPRLDAAWFVERYRFMIGLAALVLVPMLMVAAIRSIVMQDAGQLLRSFFLHLPLAILSTFIAVFLVQAALAITDSMSDAVASGVAGDVSSIFDGAGATLTESVGVAGVPSFAIFIGSVILIIGSLFVWLELLVRSAAVTMTVFFLPLILAGLVWPVTARWTRRAIEVLAAIILSKFVIVAVISLATAALSDPGKGGFGTVMSASALMLMAAFSPFALLRLIPVVEQGAINHLEGTGRRPLQLATAHGPVPHVLAAMRRNRNTGGASTAGAAVVGHSVSSSTIHRGGQPVASKPSSQLVKPPVARDRAKLQGGSPKRGHGRNKSNDG